jgi:type I restriction enzyme, S subunit
LRTTTDLIRDGQELRYSNFVQIDLPVIPIDEQIRIARHLEQITGELDLLALNSERLMALLRERRSAIISAAVTGKIDVRNLASAPAEAA